MERFLNTFEIGNAQLLILLEVVVAMLLGGVIGYEREESDKPAGLRTQMLVAGAAALFVGLGNLIVQRFGGSFGGDTIRSDGFSKPSLPASVSWGPAPSFAAPATITSKELPRRHRF